MKSNGDIYINKHLVGKDIISKQDLLDIKEAFLNFLCVKSEKDQYQEDFVSGLLDRQQDNA